MEKLLTLETYNLTIHAGDKVLIKGGMASGKTKLLTEIATALPKHQFDWLDQTLDNNFIAGTVADNLAFNLENNAVAHDVMVQQVLASAENFDLTALLQTDVYSPRLTTHQKQRLALAQILIQPTKTLLLDEPYALPDAFDGTLIVTGDFDPQLFDQVIQLSEQVSTLTDHMSLPNLIRPINPDKAILSVTQLFDGISFVIYEGEKVILTSSAELPIADTLAGLRATAGEIDFYYEEITRQPLSKRSRKVGYIMANPADMIFVERVADAAISEEILTLCGLTDVQELPLSALSFRQKRLFTTATILMQETPVLIFDQPETERFPEILAYLDRKQVTVVLTNAADQFIPLMDRQEVF
ncbi:MAG: ATP-binding cassette domain-containing protein [Streptococcaceae bacterium]|jgi:energy-coupling factor transport system ATP-binding protein|nr:ATP-binding cassette domain-containing protein [Streptococcaceae bacterium]